MKLCRVLQGFLYVMWKLELADKEEVNAMYLYERAAEEVYGFKLR